MTLEDAVDLVTQQAQTDLDPVLDPAEVQNLVTRFARAAAWQANTAYAYGALVTPTVYQGYVFRATTGGTTAATEPFWTSVYGFQAAAMPASWAQSYIWDGTVQWQLQPSLSGNFEPYDTTRATYEAWLLKAAKVSERHNYSVDGQSFSAGEVQKNCLLMAQKWAPVVV